LIEDFYLKNARSLMARGKEINGGDYTAVNVNYLTHA
jgi:hypothetical protein